MMQNSDPTPGKWALRAAALVFAGLFVFAGLVAMTVVPFERVLTSPDSFTRALDDLQIYPQVPSLAAEQALVYFNELNCPQGAVDCVDTSLEGDDTLAGLLGGLSQFDWTIIFTELLPEAWVKDQASSLIHQFFSFLNGVHPAPSLRISLYEPKVRLAGEPGQRALLHILRTRPSCTPEQIEAWLVMALLDQAPNDSLLCRPPEEALTQLTPFLNAYTQNFSQSLPDEFDLIQSTSPEQQERLVSFASRYRTARLLALASPLLALGLLGAVTLLSVRSIQHFFIWWGLPLLVTGMFGLALTFPLRESLSWLIGQFLLIGLSSTAQTTPLLYLAVHDISLQVATRAASLIMLEAVLLILAGAVFSLLALLLRKY